MLPSRLKTRLRSASQNAADRVFASLRASDWNSPPRYACERIVSSLGVIDASSGPLEGQNAVYLTTGNGIRFAGPDHAEHWNCSGARIALLKGSRRIAAALGSAPMSDGHYALLHNIIVRYVTEFSAYPFLPLRTANLLPGDSFLDIGAFRGLVSVKASRLVGAGGHVYAIEPMSSNMAFVEAHRSLNNLANTTCMRGAVSNEDSGQVDFYTTDNQVNACVEDHLGDAHTRTSVSNISTQSFARTVMERSPRRIIASITTNGTEMSLARAFLSHFQESDIDYLEMTIPIIYTREEVSAFLASIEEQVTATDIAFPWLKLIRQR